MEVHLRRCARFSLNLSPGTHNAGPDADSTHGVYFVPPRQGTTIRALLTHQAMATAGDKEGTADAGGTTHFMKASRACYCFRQARHATSDHLASDPESNPDPGSDRDSKSNPDPMSSPDPDTRP